MSAPQRRHLSRQPCTQTTDGPAQRGWAFWLIHRPASVHLEPENRNSPLPGVTADRKVAVGVTAALATALLIGGSVAWFRRTYHE